MRKKVKLLYVLVAAFVIAAAGLLALHRLDEDIAVLEDTKRETQIQLRQVNQQQSDMKLELGRADEKAYLEEVARSKGYMMKGDIKFVVVNPEALYDDYQAVQEVAVMEADGGDQQ